MDGILQHDPRTKQMIKDALYSFLYTPIEKQLKQHLDALIIKNVLISGHSHKSFMYKNVLYNCDNTPMPRKMNRLAVQLHSDMQEYLADLKKLNEKELPFVLGYINQVLNSSNDLCDYLRLLPEAVHAPMRKIISTCPCKSAKLPVETVVILQEKNQKSIDMMRRRMVTNLLIQ